jgi:hypothetical protein
MWRYSKENKANLVKLQTVENPHPACPADWQPKYLEVFYLVRDASIFSAAEKATNDVNVKTNGRNHQRKVKKERQTAAVLAPAKFGERPDHLLSTMQDAVRVEKRKELKLDYSRGVDAINTSFTRDKDEWNAKLKLTEILSSTSQEAKDKHISRVREFIAWGEEERANEGVKLAELQAVLTDGVKRLESTQGPPWLVGSGSSSVSSDVTFSGSVGTNVIVVDGDASFSSHELITYERPHHSQMSLRSPGDDFEDAAQEMENELEDNPVCSDECGRHKHPCKTEGCGQETCYFHAERCFADFGLQFDGAFLCPSCCNIQADADEAAGADAREAVRAENAAASAVGDELGAAYLAEQHTEAAARKTAATAAREQVHSEHEHPRLCPRAWKRNRVQKEPYSPP